LLNSCPLSIPSPSPGYSARNIATSLPNFLANGKEGSGARRGSGQDPEWTQMNRQGGQARQGTEPESGPKESNHG
jgi:hypothetical protein